MIKGYGKELLNSLQPKAKVMFDNAPGTISNVTGIVNASEFSVIELKTLENLVHRSLGIWNSATPGNPATVAAGGTAIFRVQKMIQFGAYTAANRNDAGDLPASEIAVKADIKGQEIARYEVESLDLDGMAFGTREAFLAFIASGVSTSQGALMDAHYLNLFVEDAKAKEAAAAGTPVLVYPEGGKPADSAAGLAKWLSADTATREANYLIVADAKTDVAREISRYNIGSDESQFGSLLYKKLTNRLLLAMPKGGNDATAIGRTLSGIDGATEVAGLGTVKDHLFFTKNIAKGTSFAKDTDFNFSKVVGLIAHKEAAFVAVQGMKVTATISPNSGNQIYVSKFNYFAEMIRDTLYRLLVTASLQ